jgi:hypothetical protein
MITALNKAYGEVYLFTNACYQGGVRGLSLWVQLCTWSPNKLLRSNSIFNLCLLYTVRFRTISNFLTNILFFFRYVSQPLRLLKVSEPLWNKMKADSTLNKPRQNRVSHCSGKKAKVLKTSGQPWVLHTALLCGLTNIILDLITQYLNYVLMFR